jgi:hypothetical protein
VSGRVRGRPPLSGVVVTQLVTHQTCVASDVAAADCLLAKSAQGVPYRPWPGPPSPAGPTRFARIRVRWCQMRVSLAWPPSHHGSPCTGHDSPADLFITRAVRVGSDLRASSSGLAQRSASVRGRPALDRPVVTQLVTQPMITAAHGSGGHADTKCCYGSHLRRGRT